MAIEPNKTLLADEQIPKITLDGVKWPVPKLAPKQNSVVTPIILKLVPNLLRCFVLRPDPENPEKPLSSLDMDRLGEVLDEKGMGDLSTIIFNALQRGHRELTRDEFDDMAMGTVEQIEAVIVIARQTGLLKPAKPGDKKPVGEAAAASQTTTSQTGQP